MPLCACILIIAVVQTGARTRARTRARTEKNQKEITEQNRTENNRTEPSREEITEQNRNRKRAYPETKRNEKDRLALAALRA